MENEEIQLGVSAFLPEHSATGFLVPVLVRVVSNESGEGKLSRVGIRENGKTRCLPRFLKVLRTRIISLTILYR